ncbi:MAG: polysaccharide deacetylase family protein [Mucinivorans sp.]
MIALSFDIEEFDLPAEHGVRLPMAKQLEVSSEGAVAILDLLDGMGVKATFFCTAFFAEQRPALIARMVSSGHEIASHSYYHSKFSTDDLATSRTVLEQISGTAVRGFRAPRMAKISMAELLVAGYEWDSSLNPCFVPGRYNNFSAPRRPFSSEGIMEIPASVSPLLRVPLFWLSAHNIPLGVYKYMCNKALRKDGVLTLYFHPWEFSLALHNETFKVPFYIRRNSGLKLSMRLASLIEYFKVRKAQFVTLSEVAKSE